jgi:hypothetical protein
VPAAAAAAAKHAHGHGITLPAADCAVLCCAVLCWVDVMQVNLPAGDYYRLQQRAADSDFISQVLCVTADHNPSLGKSYPGGCIALQRHVAHASAHLSSLVVVALVWHVRPLLSYTMGVQCSVRKAAAAAPAAPYPYHQQEHLTCSVVVLSQYPVY